MPGVVFFVYDDGVGGGGGRGVDGGELQQRGRVLGGEAGAREEVAEGDVCAGGLEGRNGAGGFGAWDGLGCSRSPLRLGEGSLEVLFRSCWLDDGEEEDWGRCVCVTSDWNVRLPGKGNAWCVGVCWYQRSNGSRIRKD